MGGRKVYLKHSNKYSNQHQKGLVLLIDKGSFWNGSCITADLRCRALRKHRCYFGGRINKNNSTLSLFQYRKRKDKNINIIFLKGRNLLILIGFILYVWQQASYLITTIPSKTKNVLLPPNGLCVMGHSTDISWI